MFRTTIPCLTVVLVFLVKCSISGSCNTQSKREDPCFFRPCHNGGTCMQNNSAPICKCTEFFTGVYCQIRRQCPSLPTPGLLTVSVTGFNAGDTAQYACLSGSHLPQGVTGRLKCWRSGKWIGSKPTHCVKDGVYIVLYKVNLQKSSYSPGYNSVYKLGYMSGYKPRYNFGYNPGYTSSYYSGYSPSYASGYKSMYSPSYTSGYKSMYSPSYTSGYKSMYSPSYTSGYKFIYGPSYSSSYSGYKSSNSGPSVLTIKLVGEKGMTPAARLVVTTPGYSTPPLQSVLTSKDIGKIHGAIISFPNNANVGGTVVVNYLAVKTADGLVYAFPSGFTVSKTIQLLVESVSGTSDSGTMK